jgi:class 3 adenylate cyclase
MDTMLLILDPEGSPFWVKLNEGETTVGRGAVPLPAEAMQLEPVTRGAAASGPITPMPFNLADTGSFPPVRTPEPQVFMGAARASAASDFGDEETMMHAPPDWGGQPVPRVDGSGARDREQLGEAQQSEQYALVVYALRKLAEVVASDPTGEQGLNDSVDILAKALHLETAVVLEVVDEHRFQARAVRHTGHLEGGEVPASRSAIRLAIRQRAPVVSENLSSDPEFKSTDSVRLYHVGALLTIPATVGDQTVGVLYLARAAGRPFSDGEIGLAHAAAAVVAGLLHRNRLQREMAANRQRAELLEGFLDPILAERVSTGTSPYGLQPYRVTVLAAELTDFQRVAVSLAPEEVITIFADFHTMVRDVIGGHGGHIISAREGSVLALFGLPEPSRTDAIWAVDTAVELVRHYDTAVRRHLGLAGGLKCGLTSGEVLAGVVGSAGVLEPVAFGRPVVLARQLAAGAPPHSVLAEQETLDQVPVPKFQVERYKLGGLEDPAGKFYLVQLKKSSP